MASNLKITEPEEIDRQISGHEQTIAELKSEIRRLRKLKKAIDLYVSHGNDGDDVPAGTQAGGEDFAPIGQAK